MLVYVKAVAIEVISANYLPILSVGGVATYRGVVNNKDITVLGYFSHIFFFSIQYHRGKWYGSDSRGYNALQR